MAKRKWVEASVFAELGKLWKRPAYVLLPQVADATGSQATRRVDAIVCQTFPSRGLWLAGVEIKCQRGDWLSELRNPAKADAIHKYCDQWFMATPPDIIRPGELPDGWGHVVVSEYSAPRVRVKPKPNPNVVALDVGFVAAVLRRADESGAEVREQLRAAAIEQARAEVSGTIDRAERITREAARASTDDERVLKAARGLKAATGVDIAGWTSDRWKGHEALIVAIHTGKVEELANAYVEAAAKIKTARERGVK